MAHIPLFQVHMPPRDELLPVLEEVLWSGFVGQGERVEKFEAELADYIGNRNIVTVNSGTSAIQLALRLAGVEGGSVISTPMTCAATNLPVLAERARIIWADIQPTTGNIDPVDVERKIERDTKAILVVHWGGQPCDMDAIMAVGRKYGIPVIEDAAHALGATWRGRKIGAATADFTCFSLQAIKHITTVDGGVLVTRDSADYHRAKLLRWYGIDRESDQLDSRIEQDIAEWGYKFHMNDVTAAIGSIQLRYLPDVLAAHQANASYYSEQLHGHIDTVQSRYYARGSWWLYTILLKDPAERAAFTEHMKAAGITVSRVHARNDTHSCFQQFRRGPLPGVEQFTSRMLCIPVHWALSHHREYIVKSALNFKR